jgi:hypothetical protein
MSIQLLVKRSNQLAVLSAKIHPPSDHTCNTTQTFPNYLAMSTLVLLAGLALLTRPALAHGGLANYTVGETWYRGCVLTAPQTYYP